MTLFKTVTDFVGGVLKADGTSVRPELQETCDHGIIFDAAEAERILAGWSPKSGAEFVMGNPASTEVRKRWPRLAGVCPKGCGFVGIGYASTEHYTAGDW